MKAFGGIEPSYRCRVNLYNIEEGNSNRLLRAALLQSNPVHSLLGIQAPTVLATAAM